MCFSGRHVQKPPPPVMPPTQASADDAATALARRLSIRRGYAATIKTSGQGASDYGTGGQVPGLSTGQATQLGAG
jgi:hypothetical protein